MSDTTDPSLYPWEEAPAADTAGPPPQPQHAEPALPPAADPEPAAATGTGTVGNAGLEAGPGAEAAREAPESGRATPPPRRTEQPTRQLVRKEYYAISEVAELVGLPAHVLRYWESQFSVLNPSKNRSGNRVYQRKEIKLILLVKQLLHDEKYTVEGAKQKLEQLRRGGDIGAATAHALDAQLLQVLREELAELSELLTPESS